MNTRILVVDDEAPLRIALVEALSREGFEVQQAGDPDAALELAEKTDFDIVVSDIRFPSQMNGIDLMRKMSDHAPDAFFIMMTGYGTIETAIEALRLGAYDYIQKPATLGDVTRKVKHLARYRDMREENRRLRSQMHLLHQPNSAGAVIGSSPIMRKVFRLVGKVASTSSTVLVIGESGTGKEVIARSIHTSGERADRPFVAIDCASIPDNLLESELFGHVRGAFTGADRDKEGLFTVARDGTLFLDEIGEIPLHLQVKLLRTIEERRVMPVGSTTPIPVAARILAATNRDLAIEVDEGRFRADLYYRLNVVQIDLPPLRDRREDIPHFLRRFIDQFNVELRKHFTGVDTAAMRALMNHQWKGNVRELENVIERAMILGEGTIIVLDDLPLNVVQVADEANPERDSLAESVQAFEAKHILKILAKVDYDSRQACEALHIGRSTLFEKLKQHGISLREVRKDRL